MTYTLFIQIEDSDNPDASALTPIRCAVICEQDSLKHAHDDFDEAIATLERNGFDNLIKLDP